MELDRQLARARNLQDRGRPVAVERDLGVRVVVGEQDVVPAQNATASSRYPSGAAAVVGLLG
jgi:hypothetical protein